MVLPKNITQIGEINGSCKVYVEDYVVSYIKQLNQLAMDKPMAVAIYGTQKEENGVDYLFVYGGAQLDYLARECRHLSQAQLQEIDRKRKKYFQEYAFLGYCLLSGEMLEGFYIYEQGICRYMSGYARFYEKNDSMLAFMLDNRLTEVSPEIVDDTKYEMVRSRQEERRRQNDAENSFLKKAEPAPKLKQETGAASFQYRFAKTAMSATFGLACVLAIALLVREGQGENMSGTDNGVWNVLTAMTSDLWEGDEEATEEAQAVMSQGRVDKLVVEDKLNQALLEENKEGIAASEEENTTMESEMPSTEAAVQEETEASAETATEETQAVQESVTASEEPEETVATIVSVDAESIAAMEASEENVQPASYMIMPGDTLIGISTRVYGSEAKISEICRLNNISNPDDIKVGAKILLP